MIAISIQTSRAFNDWICIQTSRAFNDCDKYTAHTYHSFVTGNMDI